MSLEIVNYILCLYNIIQQTMSIVLLTKVVAICTILVYLL